ncbi:uncharacterized protein LOC143544736 [Bidens hawaiensis]|uniref:uncharacterized protein LOC143544736 n=1 Tax=Bidens hawaiensis TaxID=980011 RepID=UPI00404A0015
MVVLWNISIRIAAALVKPGYERGGICIGMASETSCIVPRVEVFTLSTRVWRSSYGNLPRKSVHFFPHKGAVINGVYYWLATDEITVDGDYKFMIVSFDMTTEEFGEVILPDSLARMGLHLSKLGESLVVVGFDVHYLYQHLDVWMIRDGVPKSFTKLFTFTLTNNDVFLGFRKSGQPIIEISKGEDDCGHLSLYDPFSEHAANIGIDGRACTFNVFEFDYKETLLLLDHPNLMVYNGI